MTAETKVVVSGRMDAADSDDDDSSEEEGELEVQQPAKKAWDTPAEPQPAMPTPSPAGRVDDGSDDDAETTTHISAQHELAGLKLSLKSGRGRGYRSAIAHTVTRDMGLTAVAVGSGPRPTTGAATYGDETWGSTSNTDFVGSVGGIRPSTRAASKGIASPKSDKP